MWGWLVLLFIVNQAEAWDMKQVSQRPQVYVIRDFLSEAECDYLIDYARPHLAPSMVANGKTAKYEIHAGRTSQSMRCPDHHGDPIIFEIENRIAQATSIPPSYGENIQILNYTVGAEYKPHHDYFDPSTSAGAVFCQRGGQRKASFIMYLNTPERGGKTVFPLRKLSIKPIKGDALFFYNVDSLGQVDPWSLHAGAPVLAGEKWIATRWLRERPYQEK
jgi:prolyl 4-hydroxylase